MNIEILTKLPPVNLGFVVDPNRPILPLRLVVKDAGSAAAHAHPRGQLVYASRGVMRVECLNHRWLVASTQAVWLPPMLEHEIFFPGDVTLHSLFIDPDYVDKLPESCSVLTVNNLLHELICHVSQMQDPISESDKRFMLVLIDAISTSKRSEIYLPSAKDARVAKVMDSLAKALICKPDFNELAISVNMSSRTLARLFIKETGLTIGAWNKRLLAQVAVLKLNEGRNVTQVALELGYSSVSAFVEMFKQQIGENPGKFVKKLAEASSRFSNK